MSVSDNPQRSQQAGQRSRQARGWTVKRRDAPIRQMIVPGQVAPSVARSLVHKTGSAVARSLPVAPSCCPAVRRQRTVCRLVRWPY